MGNQVVRLSVDFTLFETKKQAHRIKHLSKNRQNEMNRAVLEGVNS
jgi:hypothetical protein